MRTRSLLAGMIFVQAINPLFSNARESIDLCGSGWSMMHDIEAVWQNDALYLPQDVNDIGSLPVNPPTGGWQRLDAGGIPVSVPGTVEEYLTRSANPQPSDCGGVSWWWRDVVIPADAKGKRVKINFESVRQRAEIYVDGRLAAYDVIGETPFEADITDFVSPGTTRRIAVRVTNPGGNFHWQDFEPMQWGDYTIIPGRGFGGIIGRVRLDVVDPVHISDLYVQNNPEPRRIKAILTIENSSVKSVKADVSVTIKDKNAPYLQMALKSLGKIALKPGDNLVEAEIECPDACLWDIDDPHLYVASARVKGAGNDDEVSKTFGFRWFEIDGVGSDAVPRLNGRRIMLRSAISWGYWPVTGLYATPDMAVKQIEAAKSLGLNMLNFHRSIGSPVVLEAADSLGLLYYEEPGGYQSARHDPFTRSLANEKIHRMIRRDRSHPSLVIYNLINELGGPTSRDSLLMAKRRADLCRAHAVDPSRVITLTSGWASTEDAEEDSKSHCRPFDSTLYMRGWWDNHRAGGPATWEDSYYRSPSDNIMYNPNRTEIQMRGEEGAISTPPRIARLVDRDRPGWDGAFWQKQYDGFKKYFEKKDLAASFGTIDSLCRAMGDVQLYHQGRRLQAMRMLDAGDIYVINGWESMPYDNHSGVVDIGRNVKGNTWTFSRFARPTYIAVSPRSQFATPGDTVRVDLHLINETGLTGDYVLAITAVAPDGAKHDAGRYDIKAEGADRFGQELVMAHEIALVSDYNGGMWTIEAALLDADGRRVADGYENILSVSDNSSLISGCGAVYGPDIDPVREYIERVTGRKVDSYDPDNGKRYDWIIVTRPTLDAPTTVPASAYDGAVKMTLFADDDIRKAVAVKTTEKIDRTFVGGAQPDPDLPANQGFSIIYEATLVAPEAGTYLVGINSDRGVRLDVNGSRQVDEWYNDKDLSITRPITLAKGEKVNVSIQYRQTHADGRVSLVWSQPGSSTISPDRLLADVKDNAATLIVLDCAESWLSEIDRISPIGYHGFYNVGSNWIGGIHFVKRHKLFDGLPQATAMDWWYQDLVRDGDRRLSFYVDREEMVVGSYRSWAFCLGSAVGVIPFGNGRVIYSGLNIPATLNSDAPSASITRHLVANMIDFANKSK